MGEILDPHSRLADELIMETECDEHILFYDHEKENVSSYIAKNPGLFPIYKPYISKTIMNDHCAFLEALQFVKCDTLFPTVEDALNAFRKKYYDAYDEGMSRTGEDKELFVKSSSCEFYLHCISVADDLIDILNASK